MDIALADVAAGQHGLLTTDQIEERDLTEWERRCLVESGWLVKVAPRVYRIRGTPDTHAQRLVLGLLSLGPHSWISYEAAAALHGLDRSDPRAVEFTIVRGTRQPTLPFAVHTTNRLPAIDRVTIDGLRVTSATRTILDLAHARSGTRRVEAAIDSAVRLGLCSPQVIAARLENLRGSGRWGCLLVEDLVVDSGGHSPLERRFLKIVREAGLPRPETQAIHRRRGHHVARVDFLFEQGVVVEVSGQHGHSSPAERAKDAQRRNELQELGRAVYEYTYREVMKRPDLVIRTLARRLEHAAQPGLRLTS